MTEIGIYKQLINPIESLKNYLNEQSDNYKQQARIWLNLSHDSYKIRCTNIYMTYITYYKTSFEIEMSSNKNHQIKMLSNHRNMQ